MERLTTSEITKNLSALGPPTPHNIGYVRSFLTSRRIQRLMKAERRRLAKAQLKNKNKNK